MCHNVGKAMQKFVTFRVDGTLQQPGVTFPPWNELKPVREKRLKVETVKKIIEVEIF